MDVFQVLAAPDAIRVERLRPIADGLGMSVAQLALAWCLRVPTVASVIVGATRPEQVVENAKSSDARLTADVLERMDRP